MASFFDSICMCCFRSRSRSPDGQRQGETNERTHLIPETIEEQPVSTYVVDQQQMDARLRTIVRAKEGKMVSVNAPLPFNLANHSVLALSQSASRSASLPPSTSRPHRFSSSSHSPPPHQRHFSPSRSSSSLRLPESSLTSPEHEHAGGNGEHKPAFNARIVRPPGTSAWMMRGRTVMRGRVGRSDNSTEVSAQEGQADAGVGPHHDSDSEYRIELKADESDSGAHAGEVGVVDQDSDQVQTFRISLADVGKISQSWDD